MDPELELEGENPPVLTATSATQLGGYVRELRQQRGYTLSEVGARTGLSIAMLSMIERGRSNPSIGSLLALADALGVPMASLFQAVTPASDGGAGVVRAATQKVIQTSSGVQRRIIASDPKRGYEVAENRYDARTESSAVLTHHQGYEVGFVLEGQLEVTVGDRTHLLSAGDAIQIESMQPHRFYNPGPHHARTIWINLQAGLGGVRDGAATDSDVKRAK